MLIMNSGPGCKELPLSSCTDKQYALNFTDLKPCLSILSSGGIPSVGEAFLAVNLLAGLLVPISCPCS